MKSMGLNEIREKYLAFFEGKGHLRHPSFSLVPQGDSSLLLINSGMAPLKPYFSGETVPPRTRMTTCQKCIRTPDIERVGKTSRHGTFFEMLGNFSFGDYFKREAAAWAWEFCTKEMEMDPERLYVSVYLDDDEAFDIWTKEVGVDPSHMTRLGKADNFWEIGSGPCGPCSEIYYDRGAEKGCGSPDCKVGCDCDRFVEFWNLVFTQYNNDGQGNYTPLAQKNIDTGMGLERLACILQNADNLFETDTVTRIRQHVCRLADVPYHQSEKMDVSLRVITDHIRSTVMLLSDGVLPSNEGRGYVLRRLLRRAARHGRLLGISGSFLCELADTVVEESESAYPELREKRDYIQKVIGNEEERFAKTIDAGLQMLLSEIEKVKDGVFPGEPAFRLYDTFGFPVDLTLEILEEHHMKLDRETFDRHMEAQRKQAKDAHAASGGAGWTSADLGAEAAGATVFTGYETLTGDAKILALLIDGETADMAEAGQSATIILDKTPFYAESGGQTADTGWIRSESGVMMVENVKKTPDGKYLHIGDITSGELEKGQSVFGEVDSDRRRAIMRAHTATHLLQKALRETLGTHVEQAGSLVEPDRLRFDFTHFSAMTPGEIALINHMVNEQILAGLPVTVREMPIAEAKAGGAMALFGEKYGDMVRVVTMGDYSVELCGGTHLSNTALVGSFLFQTDSSVAAGVRRIEARVGESALEWIAETFRSVGETAALFKTNAAGLRERVETLLAENRTLIREAEGLRREAAEGQVSELIQKGERVGSFVWICARFDGLDAAALRRMGDAVREKAPSAAAVLASVSEDKMTFCAVCGKDAVAKGAKAGVLVGTVSKLCGGSGGGKPDSAMGGGKDISRIEEAFAAARKMLEQL